MASQLMGVHVCFHLSRFFLHSGFELYVAKQAAVCWVVVSFQPGPLFTLGSWHMLGVAITWEFYCYSILVPERLNEGDD